MFGVGTFSWAKLKQKSSGPIAYLCCYTGESWNLKREQALVRQYQWNNKELWVGKTIRRPANDIVSRLWRKLEALKTNKVKWDYGFVMIIIL